MLCSQRLSGNPFDTRLAWNYQADASGGKFEIEAGKE
jgi:hypothetical protein